jgi:hypothetical protein
MVFIPTQNFGVVSQTSPAQPTQHHQIREYNNG